MELTTFTFILILPSSDAKWDILSNILLVYCDSTEACVQISACNKKGSREPRSIGLVVTGPSTVPTDYGCPTDAIMT